jgi:hypothetical protein
VKSGKYAKVGKRPVKCRVWSVKHSSGCRMWFYCCRECYDYTYMGNLNTFASGYSHTWVNAMEYINHHIELYH